jgi:hypothetical protein
MNKLTGSMFAGKRPHIPGRKGSLLLFMLVYCMTMFSQETTPALPTIKISGYVKSDIFYDTRQVISAREGHFLLFPAPKTLDPGGRDINAKSGFNMMPIQSNLAVNINGPSVYGATISGLIEGDFFGQSNADVNMFRLRHAYVKLKWASTELLVGQYWHPLFVTSCYPGTVSFNTGSPIQPFSRAPQVRLSHTEGIFNLSLALLSQRDYASVGPAGNSSKYLRDSGIPEIQFSGEMKSKKTNELIAGAGFGYKRLTPQIKTGKDYKTSEYVNGISANVYLKHTSKNLTIKLEGIYLENGSEYLTISGYAVKDSLDAEKGLVSYSPLRTASTWLEIQTNGTFLQFGIFTGFTKNLGTRDEVKGPYYVTSNLPISSLYRISPRVIVKQGNILLAAELEFTSAMYGSADDHCRIIHKSGLDNTRFLISVIYKF